MVIGLKYIEIIEKNSELEKAMGGPEYHILVLSNIIVHQLKEILEYELRSEGIAAEVSFGDYDNIIQESGNVSLARTVILFWEASNLIDGFQYKASIMDSSVKKELIEKIKLEIDFVLERLKGVPLVIWNRFSSLVFGPHPLWSNELENICLELNNHVERKKGSNVVLVDTDKVVARLSVEKSVDFRYYYASKSLYSISFLRAYSGMVKPAILAAEGKAKKALIFDCDNTLWKGIIGEDGLEGIRIGGKYPYQEIQSLVKDLGRHGVIIGLCSKNNPDDVTEVFQSHEDMVLKEEDIVIKKVNWLDKATNLRAIASELNIGLDSLVFVDDSDFEISFIKENLPEVTVLKVPEKLHEYPAVIRDNIGLFFKSSVTKEDRQKTQMYKEKLVRQEAREKFSKLDDYLRSLKLKVTVFCDDKQFIPRMSQMTQKTNQFNLTTNRYTEKEIEQFCESPDAALYVFKEQDRFGDNGLSALVIIRFNEEKKEAYIDSFMMSCRILGRNIELIIMNYLVAQLAVRGIKLLKSRYRATLKNMQVKNFYESVGFDCVDIEDKKKEYEIAIESYESRKIDYVEVVESWKKG